MDVIKIYIFMESYEAKASSVSELKRVLNRRFGRSTISNIRYPEQYQNYLLKEQEEDITEADYIYYDYSDINI